jgi:hypothetical protein
MKHNENEAPASKRHKRALGTAGTGLALLMALGTAAACGGGDQNSAAGAGGSGGEAPSADASAGTGAPADADGGAATDDAGTAEPEECRPTSKADEPDDEFTDANCDGIDGDVRRAVFVSPDGFDTDEGSIKKPVQSIGQAVVLAKEGGLDVYVCNGTYRENVVIDAPVSIYGGYDCTRDWKRGKDVAVVQGGAGLPLLVKNVTGAVHLERLAFRAAAAVGAGQSSQAGAIVGSSDVTLTQIELKAGNGAAGALGTKGNDAPAPLPRVPGQGAATILSSCYAPDAGASPGTYCDSYALGGYSATATQLCGSGFQMRGGRGGQGGNVWLAKGKPSCFLRTSDPGDDGLLGQYQTGDGNWQDVSYANSGVTGADGADGTTAPFGIGSIVDGVYLSTNAGSDGMPGQPGWPGKGGQGGYSSGHSGDVCGTDYRVGSGGGQGGLGGCGGDGAVGGKGGGGSVALVIVGSTVKISNARLAVGDGGNGGDGAWGGAPQAGAAGALGGNAASSAYRGSQGQSGGSGGRGGAGGPGGGGPSVAILYTGSTPEVTDAVYEIGTPGDGGLAVSGLNGPTGATGEMISLDEISGK